MYEGGRVCLSVRIITLYRTITLSDKYPLWHPAGTLARVGAVGWMGYVNTINELTGSDNREFSGNIMTPYFRRSLRYACYWRNQLLLIAVASGCELYLTDRCMAQSVRQKLLCIADVGSTSPQNVRPRLPNYTVSHPPKTPTAVSFPFPRCVTPNCVAYICWGIPRQWT
jgi:hypothetical protein